MKSSLILSALLSLSISLHSQPYSYMGKSWFVEYSPSVTSTFHSGTALFNLFSSTYIFSKLFEETLPWYSAFQQGISAHYIVGRRSTVLAGLYTNRPLFLDDDNPRPYFEQKGLYMGFRVYNYKNLGFLAPIGKYFELQSAIERSIFFYNEYAVDKKWEGESINGVRINLRWGYDFSIGKSLLGGMGVQLALPLLPLTQNEDPDMINVMFIDYFRYRISAIYLTVGPIF